MEQSYILRKITLKTCEGSRIPEPFHQPGFHEVHIGSCQCKGSFCCGLLSVKFRNEQKRPQTCVVFYKGYLWWMTLTTQWYGWRLPGWANGTRPWTSDVSHEVSDVSLKFTMAMLLFFYWNGSEAPAKALAKEEWLFGAGNKTTVQGVWKSGNVATSERWNLALTLNYLNCRVCLELLICWWSEACEHLYNCS